MNKFAGIALALAVSVGAPGFAQAQDAGSRAETQRVAEAADREDKGEWGWLGLLGLAGLLGLKRRDREDAVRRETVSTAR
jgi:MYXO-CTERM domain-containing protein